MKRFLPILCFAVLLCGCQTAPVVHSDKLTLPGIFGDGMVMQRGKPVAIWGSATPGARIRVAMADQRAEAMAGESGAWRVYLGPFTAGGPHTLTIRAGKLSRTVNDVLVGEVWLCSGQSNMQMTMQPGPEAVLNIDQELAAATYPEIRLLNVPRKTSFSPLEDVPGMKWEACTPETVKLFSAAGYFFGRDLHRDLGVPIGLINASYGASPIEAWTSNEALRSLSEWRPIMDMLPRLIADSAERATEYKVEYDKWFIQLDSFDEGYTDGKPLWADAAFDAREWKTVNVPGYWEDQGFHTLDGFGWYRKEIDLPASWAGKPVQLHLGGANDMHRAWFNGEQVGQFEETSGGFTLPRKYEVPAHLVKAGRNVIAVRVYDLGNMGGFVGATTDYHLDLDGGAPTDTIYLSGAWIFKPGMEVGKTPAKPVPPVYVAGNQRIPTVLYNAMISPLIPFGIRGVIWYQGESNTGRAKQYETLFPSLIHDWRARFAQGDIPFLFVQLAAVTPETDDPNAPSATAELREAQARALSGPNTGMAVAIDIGDPISAHPRNKQDVGKRLALLALDIAYGKEVEARGPMFASLEIMGSEARARFTHAEGLTTRDGKPVRGFAIAGADAVFHWAEARIEGDTIVLSNKSVPQPVHIRYAWANNPGGANLVNSAGLPAAPFRATANTLK
ncbi:MAG TPA: sialate O-acetylesterase [Candidatus Hydrogenedentes bacterium]|mgnify:FL=1|nr:sialate O-acetylesterase [Candidatus Hydrogenedentota bacterium]